MGAAQMALVNRMGTHMIDMGWAPPVGYLPHVTFSNHNFLNGVADVGLELLHGCARLHAGSFNCFYISKYMDKMKAGYCSMSMGKKGSSSHPADLNCLIISGGPSVFFLWGPRKAFMQSRFSNWGVLGGCFWGTCPQQVLYVRSLRPSCPLPPKKDRGRPLEINHDFRGQRRLLASASGGGSFVEWKCGRTSTFFCWYQLLTSATLVRTHFLPTLTGIYAIWGNINISARSWCHFPSSFHSATGSSGGRQPDRSLPSRLRSMASYLRAMCLLLPWRARKLVVCFAKWLWVKNMYPKWNPGKWKLGPKPAVPWWFNFDPHPNGPLLVGI